MPALQTHDPSTRALRTTVRQVRPSLWRVLRADGSMAGYIERIDEPSRFEARRLSSSTRQIARVGEFTSIDDALSCFR